MLKHQCLLHRFESEILARPTCEELEQGTAHATARELGRRCNPTNGADEIPSDSISHQKMWLADFFAWSQKNIDGVECSKWCRIKDVNSNSNSNISWSLVATFYMFLSGIHIFFCGIPLVALFAHSCQPFMTLQIGTVLNRYEAVCSVTIRSPWESWRMRAETALVLQPSPSAPSVSDMVRYGQMYGTTGWPSASVQWKKTNTVPQHW